MIYHTVASRYRALSCAHHQSLHVRLSFETLLICSTCEAEPCGGAVTRKGCFACELMMLAHGGVYGGSRCGRFRDRVVCCDDLFATYRTPSMRSGAIPSSDLVSNILAGTFLLASNGQNGGLKRYCEFFDRWVRRNQSLTSGGHR